MEETFGNSLNVNRDKPTNAEYLTTIADKIKNPHRNIVRMMLKMFAYNHQSGLLPRDWQIEHILPRRWRASFFEDTDATYINDMIEHIGNKTPFERILNIVASNGYFAQKQAEYKKSSVEITKVLVTSISEEIVSLLDKWDMDYVSYTQANSPVQPIPTPEEQEMINMLKAKGLI